MQYKFLPDDRFVSYGELLEHAKTMADLNTPLFSILEGKEETKFPIYNFENVEDNRIVLHVGESGTKSRTWKDLVEYLGTLPEHMLTYWVFINAGYNSYRLNDIEKDMLVIDYKDFMDNE